MKWLWLCLSLTHGLAHAQLDKHQQQGLKDTQDLMRSSQQRQEYINKDAKAQEADAKAGALAGSSENKEEIYDIASQVMEKITEQSGGDPAKMAALLKEAQQNPKAFYEKMMGAEERAKVRNLANKIEKQGGPSAGPKD